MDTLGSLEADLWLHEVEDAVPPERAARWLRLLDADERARYDRFEVPDVQSLYLEAHGMLRTVLSSYADVSPEDWRFVVNGYGRPEIAPDQAAGVPPIRFNLSHTAGLVAVVVTRTVDCGVDVEYMRPLEDAVAISGRFFSPEEIVHLAMAGPEEQHERFYAYWTLKESYIKARGMGLALPLDQFTFDWNGVGNDVAIGFGAEIDDDPRRWQFGWGRQGTDHAVALALHHPRTEPFSVLRRVFDPD